MSFDDKNMTFSCFETSDSGPWTAPVLVVPVFSPLSQTPSFTSWTENIVWKQFSSVTEQQPPWNDFPEEPSPTIRFL